MGKLTMFLVIIRFYKTKYYKWRECYCANKANELNLINELEEENALLKRIYAYLSMELDKVKYY